ncbi:MAG TPA: OmpA family protein, partial [Rectinemataceae bacterium]
EKAAAERAAAERAAAEKLAAEKAAFAALPAPSFKLSLKPQYFSPDGDGQDDTLIVSIESSAPAGFSDWKFEIFETAVVESAKAGTTAPGRLFASWSGKGAPPASISWNGRSSRGETVESATDYSYRMTATDSRGKSGSAGGTFTVDVLVIRDGDKLKINVPSIVFRANFADFIGLSTDVVDKNEQVVSRIAQILNRFPGYSIEIQGHANSISKISGLSQAKIDAEEKNELIPLSKGRAEYVKAMLIRFGVDATRLSAVGLGSSKPVVKFSDAENRWKNRRVEFVLIKKK